MLFLLMIDTPEEKRKFVILYEKYRYLMQKVATDVLHDSFLAEDAVHNAFVSVAYNLDKLDEFEDVPTKLYLVACARNAALDLYRKRGSQVKKEILLEEAMEKGGYVTYIESDLENGILDILKNLPLKYRDVFMLKYVNHMENREIYSKSALPFPHRKNEYTAYPTPNNTHHQPSTNKPHSLQSPGLLISPSLQKQPFPVLSTLRIRPVPGSGRDSR